MPTKKKRVNKHRELVETITDTLNLVQSLQKDLNYTVINQLNWNLGWKDNIYTIEILEDHYYDQQALTLVEKILQQILDTTTKKKP